MLAIIIILAVFILLAIIPLGIRGRYAPDEVLLQAFCGPIKFELYPGNGDKPGKHKKPETGGAEDAPTEKAPKKNDIDVKELLKAAIPALFDTLDRFRRKLTVNELTLWFSSGSPDPYDAAMGYGTVSAILGALLPVLDRYFRIKKQDIRTAVNFEAEENTILADIRLTLRVYEIVYIAFGMWPAVKVLLRKKDNRKAEEHG